ncbi:pyroglutamyl-peptidase I [Deinococcus aerophilus]|uniref:Pyroglutamyl-peptidase I n=1 Tax=Deinococcus aerophilus TaxID=522488 RepID=A0ABQ2GV60_9DEIO|nr:pyroglutamyl-peptidase I [Deinococcus aerophilus]GGM12409.1 pyrrolidone-carboxylate peptidase [Deinococcus aerophilus]
MSTLLLTGFEPFHTHPANPSAEAAQELDGLQLGSLQGGGVQVVSALLPVEPHAAASVLEGLLERHRPGAVLLTGLAAGRPHVTLERVALNVMDFSIPDNAGNTYRDAPAHPHPDAPPAHLSTLPLRAILAAWREAGIPGSISNTAGLYVCNAVMYRARQWLTERDRPGVPCGFLHLPANAAVALAAPEDRPALPYLPQPEITRAVRVAAQTVAAELPVLTGSR